jgi:hypothetical protein
MILIQGLTKAFGNGIVDMAYNPDLNSGERIFSYIVSAVPANGGTASGLPFVDTEGNRIQCNYFELTIHYDYSNDITDRVFYHAEPSSTQYTFTENSMSVHNHIADEYNMNDVVAGNVSGICGYAGFADARNPGHMQYKADNGALIDSVQIRLEEENKNQPGVIDLEITYGNITAFNPLRQDKFDRGV